MKLSTDLNEGDWGRDHGSSDSDCTEGGSGSSEPNEKLPQMLR